MAQGFGVDLDGYVLGTCYRGQAQNPTFTYSAVELGTLHDRGPSPCCPESYRACQGTDPNVLESVSFTDRENLSIRKSPPPNLKLPRIGLCHTGAPPL